MTLADKLKKTQSEAPAKVLPKCPKCERTFPWARKIIGLANGNDTIITCERECCIFCGKQKKTPNGNPVVYYTIGDGCYKWDARDFNVPREYCTEPRFNKDGTAVLGLDGKQVHEYVEAKKIGFVRRLLGLVKWEHPFDQYFTPEQVLTGMTPEPTPEPEQGEGGEVPI